jgi:hypothetical protein
MREMMKDIVGNPPAPALAAVRDLSTGRDDRTVFPLAEMSAALSPLTVEEREVGSPWRSRPAGNGIYRRAAKACF